MPLWEERHLSDGSQLGIWKIEEPEQFFFDRLSLAQVEQAELAPLRGRRRIEWLASRYLIHDLLSDEPEWDRIPLQKDEFGKPHHYGSPLELSFSHTHEWVAVIISERPVGIDIQVFVEKIGRLKSKFLRPSELDSLRPESDLEHLHFYWAAKEALYKAYGRRELDWKEHILVEPFDFEPDTKSTGQICKGDLCQNYELIFEKHVAFYLSIARITDPK